MIPPHKSGDADDPAFIVDGTEISQGVTKPFLWESSLVVLQGTLTARRFGRYFTPIVLPMLRRCAIYTDNARPCATLPSDFKKFWHLPDHNLSPIEHVWTLGSDEDDLEELTAQMQLCPQSIK
ncbi:hypothetical protein TNCV_1716471 [Trichonephila clavipes]|nr:hypothetical protein TNCV_1716471 [Trichonephila clavipes]